MYLPADALAGGEFPQPLLDLLTGTVVSAADRPDKECRIYKKYLLKKIIARISKIDSAKSLGLEYMPYIMNQLGLIYMTAAADGKNENDFKIIANLFETALKYQKQIFEPTHLGCIYLHLGQLNDCASVYADKHSDVYFRAAIADYRQAQKYFGKYTYPYDHGHICYKLSGLYYNYWKRTEDLQALRDSVSQLRECERIFTQAQFPGFWGHIEGSLGYLLHNLGHRTRSPDICRLAVAAYRNQQKIVTETGSRFTGRASSRKLPKPIIWKAKSPPTAKPWKRRWPATMTRSIFLKPPNAHRPRKKPAPASPKPGRCWPSWRPMRKKRKRKTLLNRNRLGQVARLIDFAPQQIGNIISQKLQRQIQQKRRKYFRGRRHRQQQIEQLFRPPVTVKAHAGQKRMSGPRFLAVGNHFVINPAAGRQHRRHRHIFIKQRNRPVFQFSRRVAVGIDVADLFQFQGAFLRRRQIDAAGNINHLPVVFQPFRRGLHFSVLAQRLFHFGRQLPQFVAQFSEFGRRQTSPRGGKRQPQKVQTGQLGGVGFGGGHADLNPRFQRQQTAGMADDARILAVGQNQNMRAAFFRPFDRGDGIGRFARLGNADRQRFSSVRQLR